jgi:hypothetical protein
VRFVCAGWCLDFNCVLLIVPLHGLYLRFNCRVCIIRSQPNTAGGYTLVELCLRCIQNFLFSCEDSCRHCPDPPDLWLDLLDLFFSDAIATAWMHRTLHVNPFDPVVVRRFCMPWLLDPFCFLSACPAICFCCCVLDSCLLCPCIGGFVAYAAVLAVERVFAPGLVHRCLGPLSLRPSSRVPRRCHPSFHPFGVAEAEAPLRQGVVLALLVFLCPQSIAILFFCSAFCCAKTI